MKRYLRIKSFNVFLFSFLFLVISTGISQAHETHNLEYEGSQFNRWGSFTGMAMVGDSLLASSVMNGTMLIDFNDPANPQHLGTIQEAHGIIDIQDNMVLSIMGSEAFIREYNTDNTFTPIFNFFDAPEHESKMGGHFYGDYLLLYAKYLTEDDWIPYKHLIYDISDPSLPQLYCEIEDWGLERPIYVHDGHLIEQTENGIILYHDYVGNEADTTLIPFDVRNIALNGELLYANVYQEETSSFYIMCWSLADPRDPNILCEYELFSTPYYLAVYEDKLYVKYYIENQYHLYEYNVEDPSFPVEAGMMSYNHEVYDLNIFVPTSNGFITANVVYPEGPQICAFEKNENNEFDLVSGLTGDTRAVDALTNGHNRAYAKTQRDLTLYALEYRPAAQPEIVEEYEVITNEGSYDEFARSENYLVEAKTVYNEGYYVFLYEIDEDENLTLLSETMINAVPGIPGNILINDDRWLAFNSYSVNHFYRFDEQGILTFISEIDDHRYALELDRHYAYLNGSDYADILVYDLNYPDEEPVTFYDNDELISLDQIRVKDNYAYAPFRYSNYPLADSFDSLKVFEVSDPLNPVLVNTIPNGSWFDHPSKDATIHGDFYIQSIVTSHYRDNIVEVFAIENPEHPELIASIDFDFSEFGHPGYETIVDVGMIGDDQLLVLTRFALHSYRLGDYELNVEEDKVSKNFPLSYEIISVYPNPFNSSTRLNFINPITQKYQISIYDILGRKVQNLVKGEIEAGNHTFYINGKDLSSGTYFLQIQSTDRAQVKRFQLIK